ncbi:chemotaxis protein MotA [Aequitasia blattaphilus]|uniref:MotA/TolQ/ExbB proton channel family protein n=1 Tax=Aequitasia blattaphilus TaxID=2949332 RepID=A0ABT1EC43_9FIRM|nr:MotA/TolQ/ExbB proton channel family protein [Aequitasia blattaphilus]MCP1102512.1 MotA/TolQ/ExbB proton channel family protein [Aequitasia blattaphilus]MCR8615152.1 MotA/TolQ/ExbB proton channel family protein [Aequitasia blattaphilus]
MDLTTIIGVLGGMAFIINGIVGSGKLDNFVDIPSVVIVVGGTICAVIASFPFSMLKNVGAHMKKLISNKAYKVEPVINDLVEFAQIARKNGLLALEEKANKLKDPFFKQGIMLVVDATEPDKAREMLEMELDAMVARHEEEIAIYDKAASYAPAFGMIGTLIGLINMLMSMDLSQGSSSSLGQNMAVAMITTFYGCMLANLIFSPIAKKLRIRNEEEVLYKQIIIEGVIDIQAGVNPKNIKEKMVSLLQQKRQRVLLEGKGSKGKGKGNAKEMKAGSPS